MYKVKYCEIDEQGKKHYRISILDTQEAKAFLAKYGIHMLNATKWVTDVKVQGIER